MFMENIEEYLSIENKIVSFAAFLNDLCVLHSLLFVMSDNANSI